MKPLERDAAYLWDMLDAAKKAAEFSAEVELDQLLDDIRTRYAVERALEIVGEGARRVSQETRGRIRKFLGQVSSDSAMFSPINTVISTTGGFIWFSRMASRSLSAPWKTLSTQSKTNR